MNEQAITAKRTPEIIAGEIRTFTASMLNNIIEIGRRMCEAKELLPYGEFGKWITEATGYSSSTANNFMRLFQEYGADQGCLFGAEVDCQTFGKLSYSKALALLAVPKEERETVAAELDAEHLSTRELERAIRERDEARKALQDTSARLEQAEKTLAGARDHETELNRKLAEARDDLQAADIEFAENERALKARIQELESKPVEVAVERDEEAIKAAAAEARRAAEAAAKAEMDKLRERLERAQKAQKKAEEETKRAVEDAGPYKEKMQAQAEEATREIAELKRKLASAESGAGEVAMLARMAQGNFAAAMDKIEAMKAAHADTAAKMLTGMERIVEALSERVRAVKG